MKLSVLFSSQNGEWETPPEIFNPLQSEFGLFDLDPAASSENAKAKRYFTEGEDGLSKPWDAKKIWLNPPYGKNIGRWLERAREAMGNGSTVVCLLHARTDTKWWHTHVEKVASEIRFIRGRIRFIHYGQRKQNAPFPSVIVIYSQRKVNL